METVKTTRESSSREAAGASNETVQAKNPPSFQLQAAPIQRQEAASNSTGESNTLTITAGELTATGEGSDAATKYIHWPNTAASGVTLGKGYDIGSRSAQQVIDELTAAGMGVDQATKISKGAGLKGSAAGQFVTTNKTDIGVIDREVQYKLLATMLVEYTGKAKSIATSETATKDNSGAYTNARGRELSEGVAAGTYRMTTEQWDALHPAMIEFVTDLKYQGGYYLYDRVAKVNKALIDNHGNHLEQFKAVAKIFESDTEGELSYMDSYGKKIGEGTGNTENFYGQSSEDLAGASTRRNRIRLAYLKQIISALEAGKTVEMASDKEEETATTTPATNNTTPAAPPANNSNTTTPATPSTPAAPAVTYTASSLTYTVQAGESLGALAKKLSTSIDALKAVNADKLKKWGSVEGFEAGATIKVPQGGKLPTSSTSTTPATKPASNTSTTKPVAAPTLDYGGMSKRLYDAFFAVAYGTGFGTDEDAVYAELAKLEKKQDRIDQLKSTYQKMYRRDLINDIKAEFNDFWNGDHSQRALAYLNHSANGSPQPKPQQPANNTPAQKPATNNGSNTTSQGTAPASTAYVSRPLSGSVGSKGANLAVDVKIVQQNLVLFGLMPANHSEITAVAAMKDTDKVEDANLSATIAAITLYQTHTLAMGAKADGNIGATGGTFKSMDARLKKMAEYASHTVKTEAIAPVMANDSWISQFRNGANVKSDGTSVNMTISAPGRGLKETEKAYAAKSNYVCCFDACKAMVGYAGGTMSGDKTSSLQSMVQKDGTNKELGNQAAIGVKYIDKTLLAGKPVMIGVDDGRTASYNYDNTTEHYIVIMGKVVKDGKIYYRYFDPGTSSGTKGTSESNLLYLGENNQLSGAKPGSQKTYTMAHVRVD